MSAAVTGHLVLTTIHTVDAPSAVVRLLEMGVPPFLVAGGLAGVVAQRLVRKLCARCAGRGGRECPVCTDGYHGRNGVFEVLVVDDAMRTAVSSGASISSLRALARENGMGSMARDAMRKVAEGATSPHEAGKIIALSADRRPSAAAATRRFPQAPPAARGADGPAARHAPAARPSQPSGGSAPPASGRPLPWRDCLRGRRAAHRVRPRRSPCERSAPRSAPVADSPRSPALRAPASNRRSSRTRALPHLRPSTASSPRCRRAE